MFTQIKHRRLAIFLIGLTLGSAASVLGQESKSTKRSNQSLLADQFFGPSLPTFARGIFIGARADERCSPT